MTFQSSAFQTNAFQASNDGIIAVAEAQDAFAAVGGHAQAGALVATEAQDAFTGVGKRVEAGALVVTESQDAFAAIGERVESGEFTSTEAQDAFAAVGECAHGGAFVVAEAQDTFAAVGGRTLGGALADTEVQDDASFIGWASTPSFGVLDPAIRMETPRLDLAAEAQALTGDASATPQMTVRFDAMEAVINHLYSAVMPLNPMYRDAVDVSDVVTVSFAHAFFDSLQLADAQTLDRTRETDEVVAISDARTLTVEWMRAFAEAVFAQDAIHVLTPGGSILADSVGLADLLQRIVALQKDDLTLVTDQTAAALIPRPQESANVTDDLSRTVSYRRTFPEAAPVSEQMARLTSKSVASPVAVADQKFGGWDKALADGLFTSDVQTRVLGKGLGDTAAVADASAVTVNFRRTLADVVFATDIFSSLTNDLVRFTDSVTMLDARVKTLAKPHIESVTLTDGLVKGYNRPVADTVTLASAGTITGQGYANNYFAEDYVSGTLATFT